MAIGIGAGLTALSAKLLALLKAGKISAGAAKAALAAKKAGGAARMANSGFFKSALGRAGYQGPLDVGLSVVPDLAYAGIGFATQPGDLADKSIAAGSQLLLGGVGSGAIRAAVNPGRFVKQARRAESLVDKMKSGQAVMDPKRMIRLQDQASGLRNKATGLGQSVEMGVMLPGGYFSYDLAQAAMRGKDKLFGGEGLSPTEKILLEDEMAREEQLLAAYRAGQSAGAQGAVFYDPYTGEVPLGGGYGY